MGARAALEGLRARWWLPVIGVVLGVLSALAVTASTVPHYRSTTRLFVGTTGTTDVAALYAGGLFTEQRVASYVELAQGERMSGEVVRRLGLTTSPAELASRVTARVLPNTVVVEISVVDRSAAGARALADAYAGQFVTDVTTLETAPHRGSATVRVSAVEAAVLSPTPVSPVPYRDDALGALLGLLAGTALASAAPGLSSRVRWRSAVESLTSAPVLTVTDDRAAVGPDGVLALRGRSTAGRTAQTAGLRLGAAGAHTVVLSSPAGGEGRSTVALSVADALCRSGRRVLLVDADPGGGVSRALGLLERPGLAEVLAGTADPRAVVWSAADGGPCVLGSGTAEGAGAVDRRGSARLAEMVAALRPDFDHVVVDVPPMLSGVDLVDLARPAGGVVLVCRFGTTRRTDLASAVTGLAEQDVDVVGVVLNRVPEDVAVRRRWCQRYAADPQRQTAGATGRHSAAVEQRPVDGVPAAVALGTLAAGAPERLSSAALLAPSVGTVAVRATSAVLTAPAPPSPPSSPASPPASPPSAAPGLGGGPTRGAGGRLLTVVRAARDAGYVDLLLAQVVPLGVSFLLTLFSASLLGPERRGVLTFLTTAALLFGALAFGSLHVPVVSGLRDGDRTSLGHGVRVVLWLWGAMSLAGLLLVVGGRVVGGSWTLRTSTEVGWSLLGGGLVVAQFFAQRVLQGLAHHREYQTVVVVQSLLYLVGTGAVLLATRSPLLMFAAWYCSVVVGVLMAVAYLRRHLPAPSGRTSSRPALRAFLRTATANNVGSIGQMVMLRADVLVVAVVVGPAAAGVYGIALSLTELALIAPEVFSLSVYANRARMTAERWSVHLRQTLRLSAAVTLTAIAGIALAAVVLAAGPLSSYSHLVPLVLIILPGTLYAGYSRVALAALQALDEPSAVWRFGVLALAVAVAYVPAALLAGSYGTAVMSTVAYALTSLYLRHALRTRQAVR